jgi:hypothetical protein
MTNNINPFLHPRYTPSEIEAAMPMDDRIAVLRCLMNAEIYHWHGRFLAAAVLRGTAAGIVGDTTEMMEAQS